MKEQIIKFISLITNGAVTLTDHHAQHLINLINQYTPVTHTLKSYRYNGAAAKYEEIHTTQLSVFQFNRLMAYPDMYFAEDIKCYKHELYLETGKPARIIYITGSDINQIL